MASRASAYRPAEPASLDARRAARHPVLVTRATIRGHGEQPVTAILNDLSTFGCRVATPAGHEPGERVWLRLSGGLPVPATVVWAADGVAGCRFDQPIERELVRSMTLGLLAA